MKEVLRKYFDCSYQILYFFQAQHLVSRIKAHHFMIYSFIHKREEIDYKDALKPKLLKFILFQLYVFII